MGTCALLLVLVVLLLLLLLFWWWRLWLLLLLWRRIGTSAEVRLARVTTSRLMSGRKMAVEEHDAFSSTRIVTFHCT